MTIPGSIIAVISRPTRPMAGPLERLQYHPVIWLARQPLFWAILGIVLGPYLFWRGFHLLQRKRLIMDIPRSTIRAAALGAVEISGQASGPYTLVSPLANADCLYYRVLLRVGPPGARAGKTLADEMCAPLFVEDGTGRVLMDPQGAELLLPGPQIDGIGSEYLRHLLARHGYRQENLLSAKEMCIQPGDPLFVLGTLQENPWAKASATASEFERIGNFVSESEAAIQQSDAFSQPAMVPEATGVRSSRGDFDLRPPAILGKGRTPFVISNQSQREVVAQLNWTSVVYIWAGPVMAVASLWEIVSRLTAWGLLAAR
jgi:hypothetical protein